MFRAGFGLFVDRQNLTFFFVPNTQKVVGRLSMRQSCASFDRSACNAAGILPQVLPTSMSNLGQANQGYQLFGFPAAPGRGSACSEHYQQVRYDHCGPGQFRWPALALLHGACGIGKGGMEHN